MQSRDHQGAVPKINGFALHPRVASAFRAAPQIRQTLTELHRGSTGVQSGRKEPHEKGIVNHLDLESCAVFRSLRRRQRQNAQGDVIIVCFADDAVIGFQHEREAKKFLEDLEEQLGKHGWN